MISRVMEIISPRRARQEKFQRLVESGRARIGRHSYAIPRIQTYDYDDTGVSIGNFTSIGAGVTLILGGNHRLDRSTTFPLRQKLGLEGAGQDGFPWSKGSIEIGSDVWIGHGSVILSGVHIGHGAVVGAGSVVSKDIAPYQIYAGNPAKFIRHRIDEDLIPRFLELAWWEWPDSDIVEVAAALSDLDPSEAIEVLEQHRDARAGV